MSCLRKRQVEASPQHSQLAPVCSSFSLGCSGIIGIDRERRGGVVRGDRDGSAEGSSRPQTLLGDPTKAAGTFYCLFTKAE